MSQVAAESSERGVAVVRAFPAPAPLSQDIERLLVHGDLSKLSPEQSVDYYVYRCRSVGLDPAARPFDYLMLNGKKVLYANKGATEQLRRIHGLSCQITAHETIGGDVHVVRVRVASGDGRFTESSGAVALGNLKGEALANALMKAETKAHRRATLAHLGLGMLDETEMETIPGARKEPPPVVAPDYTAKVAEYAKGYRDAKGDRAKGLEVSARIKNEPEAVRRHPDVMAAWTAWNESTKAVQPPPPSSPADATPTEHDVMADSMCARIEELKAYKALDNWAKKHEGEINALPAEYRKRVATAMGAQRSKIKAQLAARDDAERGGPAPPDEEQERAEYADQDIPF